MRVLAHDLEQRASTLFDVGRPSERVDERDAVGRIETTRLDEQQKQVHEAVPLLDLDFDFGRRPVADCADRWWAELFGCHVPPNLAGTSGTLGTGLPKRPGTVYRETTRIRSTGRRTLSEYHLNRAA